MTQLLLMMTLELQQSAPKLLGMAAIKGPEPLRAAIELVKLEGFLRVAAAFGLLLLSTSQSPSMEL
jgi:hypothetical protein